MNSARKRPLFLLVLLAVIVGVTTDTGNAQGQAWKWPKTLVVMDTNTAAPSYVLAVAWTGVHEKETGAKWRVLAGTSSVSKLTMLKRGEADFWYADLSTSAELMEANLQYATKDGGATQLRIGFQGFSQMSGLAVLGDSSIKTIKDIKPGTRYGVPVGTFVIQQYFDAFRKWFGLSEKEFIAVPFGSFPAANKALAERKVDVVFNDPASIFAREIEGGPHGVRFLDLPYDEDKEGFARFRDVIPTIDFDKVRQGVKGSIGARMMKIRFISVCMASLDPEMIYSIVKWADQRHDAYKGLNWNAPMMNINAFRDTLNMTYIPVHEGAIRYMKEIGKWSAADDRRQQYNLKLVDWYCKAYADAVTKAEAKKIKISPQEKAWVSFWKEYKKEIGIPRFRIMTDAEIAEGLPKLN